MKLELKWSLTNAPGPDEIVLDKIKSRVFSPSGLKREGMTLLEEDSIAGRSYGEAGCCSGSYLCFIGQSKGDSARHGSVKGSLEASDKEDYLGRVGDEEDYSVTTTF